MIRDEVLESFHGKTALVTGGTGMIGRQVAKMLCDAGSHVRIVSLDHIQIDPRAENVFGDLTRLDLCKEVTADMDFVFHLAGIKGSMKVSGTMLASHFVPTLMFNTNLLEAARLNKVKKLVYTSSIGAYANAEVLREDDNPDAPPMDFAGWAKRMGELQIHAYRVQYGLDTFSIVRPTNVYGPGDNFDPENAMVVGALMTRIDRKEDPVVVWGDGSAIRDMAFSRDIAEGIILALHHGTRGKFVNLGGPQGYSVRELVETLAEFLRFNYVFDTTKPSGWPKRVMDSMLARQMIDYNPTTSLLDGLKETWQWFQENKDEYRHKKNYFQEG
ncbi:MAG: NAD-dependent epimerase/dehydratase family protein [Desulfomonilaceae bacterium]